MTAVDVGNETALSFGTRDPRSPRLRPDGYEGKFVAATRKQVCQKRRKESNKLQGWTYILNDAGLPDHPMVPVYPLGLNVLLARVGGTVYAVSGKWAHMACPLSAGRLESSTIVCARAMIGASRFGREDFSMRCLPESKTYRSCFYAQSCRGRGAASM